MAEVITTIMALHAELDSARATEKRIEADLKTSVSSARDARLKAEQTEFAASTDRARAILDNRLPSRDLANAVTLAEQDASKAEQRVKDCRKAVEVARQGVISAQQRIEQHKLSALRQAVNGSVQSAMDARRTYGAHLAHLRDLAVAHGFPDGLPADLVFGARDPNDLTAWIQHESEAFAMNTVLALHDQEKGAKR